MSSNADIITGFMKAWGELDLDKIMDHFTEDAAYANIPMGPPNVGKGERAYGKRSNCYAVRGSLYVQTGRYPAEEGR